MAQFSGHWWQQLVKYKLVLVLSWINRLASEIIATSVRVVASCREAAAPVQPCVVQDTK